MIIPLKSFRGTCTPPTPSHMERLACLPHIVAACGHSVWQTGRIVNHHVFAFGRGGCAPTPHFLKILRTCLHHTPASGTELHCSPASSFKQACMLWSNSVMRQQGVQETPDLQVTTCLQIGGVAFKLCVLCHATAACWHSMVFDDKLQGFRTDLYNQPLSQKS